MWLRVSACTDNLLLQTSLVIVPGLAMRKDIQFPGLFIVVN